MTRIKLLLPLFSIVLMFSGCSDESASINVASSIPVRVEPVTLKPIKEYVFTTGTVFPVKEALLKAEQQGFYTLQTNPRTRSPFAMGDKVREGDVVVVFENPEFVNQTAIESKKLNYESSQREHEKQKRVYEKGGITLSELTAAEKAHIDSRYSYENAKIALDKLKITIPFDGLIVDLPFYSANQWIDAASLIVQVMDYSRLYTEATLPGKEMSRVSRGQEAIVTNYSSSDTPLTGTITQISPALDPESRMFKLRLEIPNKELLLKPGMFIKIDIVVEEKDSTLVIPREIILSRRGSKTVFIERRGIAIERRLETGLANRDEVEVLKGLEAEDLLVIEGFETLRNRSRVKVIK